MSLEENKKKKSKDLDNQIKSIEKIIWREYGLKCEELVDKLIKLKIEKELEKRNETIKNE
jgi:hypothetical protein